MENMGDGRDFITPKQFVEIKELDHLEKDNIDCFRLYCLQNGCGHKGNSLFALQIRTFKPSDYLQNGKPRNMIANIHFTLDELKELVAIAESQVRR